MNRWISTCTPFSGPTHQNTLLAPHTSLHTHVPLNHFGQQPSGLMALHRCPGDWMVWTIATCCCHLPPQCAFCFKHSLLMFWSLHFHRHSLLLFLLLLLRTP